LAKFFANATTSSSGGTPLFNTGKATEPPHLVLHAALASGKAKRLDKEVQRLRSVKSAAELRVMKMAGDISSDGHTKVISRVQMVETGYSF
jgi:Xaa-Pro aminopeptidase